MKICKMAAALLMVAPGLAAAQNVTLYGVVDTGIAFVNGVGQARDTETFMPGLTSTVPSRWGLRGSEDIGGGNKAIFWLESGFLPDSGASGQGGRLFGRQALVGLSGRWGQVALGRQYTMLFWAMTEPDMLGPNLFGSGSLDSYIPNTRADNAMSYKGTFGGVTVGATYSFGRDTVNAGPSPAGTNCAGENPADQRACREWSVLLKYDAARWSVAAAYDSLRGGPGAFAGLTSSALTDDRLSLNGYFMVGEAKIGGGWLRRDNRASATPRSDLYYLGTSYPITPTISVDAEAYHLRFHNSPNKAWMFAGRGTYAFSKRTSVYATAGFIDNLGNLALSVNSGQAGTNPAPGGNQFGAMVGMKQIF
ncbi:porin gram-negative type (plasmid) [Cupriavidus necator N-1]|uniref:Porin gram-negative type n=1 Tax=Cupriavidus necator (strain ATCC 43291 / DSM 13513 / CCUG 52238 / LMG 8453 / N-1) TaxID=1042878 RepID=F8GV95_CUPNN|nr:porin [Cupriavidus necator]AEI82595.1 porin gram-negative type [Cupriavidus necator N-1]MDX6007596.1 porin [Cupriavidus necator]